MLQVLFIGVVIIIGSTEKRFKWMENRTYHWIQDDGPHWLARSRKVHQYSERKFKYFMLESYGAQSARGLSLKSTHSLTLRSVLNYKEKDKSIEDFFMKLFNN